MFVLAGRVSGPARIVPFGADGYELEHRLGHRLEALVTLAHVMENQPFLDMLWRACFRWQIQPSHQPS
jgi:hypothetical protein